MNPSIFNFNEHGVRVVLDDNQEPWFCLTDVCKVLNRTGFVGDFFI